MTDFKSERPAPEEYHPFYQGYVALVPEGDLLDALAHQSADMVSLLERVSEERAGQSYEPGKWTFKELVGHVIDGERVFAYRAMCLARGESQPLPGMDQDTYVQHANFNARTLADLVAEFEHVRASTLHLIRGFDASAWSRRGVVNDNEITVRALAHIIAGHTAHHLKVLRERYLATVDELDDTRRGTMMDDNKENTGAAPAADEREQQHPRVELGPMEKLEEEDSSGERTPGVQKPNSEVQSEVNPNTE